MSPPLTLKETMRAAGDPRLTDWHQKLVGKGHEKKNLEEKLNTDISKRDQVQTQMDKIRPDVEQFENRQNQEKEVSQYFTYADRLLMAVARGSTVDGTSC
jgi:DNA-directed RNA polymerase beta subunit